MLCHNALTTFFFFLYFLFNLSGESRQLPPKYVSAWEFGSFSWPLSLLAGSGLEGSVGFLFDRAKSSEMLFEVIKKGFWSINVRYYPLLYCTKSYTTPENVVLLWLLSKGYNNVVIKEVISTEYWYWFAKISEVNLHKAKILVPSFC